ncbi:hypothetical protein F5Y07DRAFT_334707 [Xylaria sp. FL0933]|nr:hypothetical protein F5Y07DRAFT_334707 [Xylaria sp. FL0933]
MCVSAVVTAGVLYWSLLLVWPWLTHIPRVTPLSPFMPTPPTACKMHENDKCGLSRFLLPVRTARDFSFTSSPHHHPHNPYTSLTKDDIFYLLRVFAVFGFGIISGLGATLYKRIPMSGLVCAGWSQCPSDGCGQPTYIVCITEPPRAPLRE